MVPRWCSNVFHGSSTMPKLFFRAAVRMPAFDQFVGRF
jgi:hypothetical protein